jgi:hypothetical protein
MPQQPDSARVTVNNAPLGEPEPTFPERPWEIEERAAPVTNRLDLGANPPIAAGTDAAIDLGEIRREREAKALRRWEADRR